MSIQQYTGHLDIETPEPDTAYGEWVSYKDHLAEIEVMEKKITALIQLVGELSPPHFYDVTYRTLDVVVKINEGK